MPLPFVKLTLQAPPFPLNVYLYTINYDMLIT